MSLRVPWLADVLRAAGLTVVEQPNWKYYRMEYNLLSLPGSPPTLQGIVCHHTASPVKSTLATNLNVVTNGNGIAPGPIAQLMLWRDGTYYCIAAGKANHAGAGGPVGGWIPDTTKQSVGNDRLLGIEACNDGVGELWAPVMVDAYERGVAAILDYLKLPSSRAITHHEWAPLRKIDPAGPTSGMVATLPRSQTWDGDAWRARIATHMANLRPIPPDPLPPTSTEVSEMFLIKGAAPDIWLVMPHADPKKTRRVHVTPDQYDKDVIDFGVERHVVDVNEWGVVAG